jgi:hypothetical protein
MTYEKFNLRILDLAFENKCEVSQIVAYLVANRLILIDPSTMLMMPSPLGFMKGYFDPEGVTTGEPQLLEETARHNVLIGYFKGVLVKVLQDKQTNKISMDLQCLAPILGYKDAEDMLGKDEVLDCLQTIKNTIGYWPVETITQKDYEKQTNKS